MRPGKAASVLSAATAVLMMLASSSAFEGPRHLSCPHSVVPEVPVTCYASGNVVAGANVTYTFAIAMDSEPFDLVVTLQTQAGDADLVVDVPDGRQLVSRHGSGQDVVFLPRDKVAGGDYVVTVVGAGDQSSYKLLVEKHNKQRTLAAADRAALQQILEGPCCSRPGSCTSLRTGLLASASDPALAPAPTAAAVDATTGAAAAADGSSAHETDSEGAVQRSGGVGGGRDLCNMGQNLCDPEGHLMHLALVNEYLSCQFPSEPLATLSSLTLLDLTMNDLTGTLEADVVPVIQRLPALQNILLSHNKLEGSLTCDLATASLAELGLAANQLQGSIPACLVQSPVLQELYLANNDLEGSLPQPLPDSKLLIISASGMRLNGSIPDLSALPQLQVLQLQSNQLSGGLPAMPPAMRYVDLEYNGIRGPIPSQWSALVELEVLRLRHNELTGSLPAELAQRDSLEQLLLSHNQFNGSLPPAWHAPELGTLSLQYNQFTGPVPGALASLPALKVLQLTGNRLSGTLDFFAQALAAAPTPSHLQLLDASSNQLSGPVPQELLALRLFADGGDSFVMVDGIAVPESFDLSDNDLSGTFPGWLPQAMVDSRAVISLEDNRLACPTEPIFATESLPYNRLLGLECIAPDGSVQPVSAMLHIRPLPQAADVAAPTPAAAAAAPDAAAAADAAPAPAVPTPGAGATAAPNVAAAPAAATEAAAAAAAAPDLARSHSTRSGGGGGDFTVAAEAAAEQTQYSGDATTAGAEKPSGGSSGGGAAAGPAAGASSPAGPAGGEPHAAAAADGGGGSSSSATGSGTGSGTDSEGGMPGWAIALVVLGSFAAAALVAAVAGPWLRHRVRLARSARYETYRTDAPSAADAAADAVLAKRQAIALAELDSAARRKAAAGGSGLAGAWGLGGGAAAPGACSTSPSSAAEAAEVFRIGTTVQPANPFHDSPV